MMTLNRRHTPTTDLPSAPNRAEYYSDAAVTVTNRIVRIHGTSYVLSHVNSVKTLHHRPSYLSAAVGGFLIGIFIGTLIAYFLALLLRANNAIFLVALLTGVVVAIIAAARQRSIYVLQVSMSSGETGVLRSHDDVYLRRIAALILKALAEQPA